ncbi:MAG: hypothetical protein HY681_09470 [Chloroflexi bacterium]|nr:hypothetical protein [Chloroflexota bacterium]
MEKKLFPRTMDQRFLAAFIDCLGSRLEMARFGAEWLHLEDPQFAQMLEQFRRSTGGFEGMDEGSKEVMGIIFAAAAMAAWDAHEDYGPDER